MSTFVAARFMLAAAIRASATPIEVVDAVLGPDYSGTVQRNVMRDFMTTLDREFACFVNRDVDMVDPHDSVWNGETDEGRGVASGVYLVSPFAAEKKGGGRTRVTLLK